MNWLSQRTAEVADQLVACVCDAVATVGAGPACFCGQVSAPQPAWDYCGECSGSTCGMVYVAVTSVYSYETFPEPITYSRCDRPFAINVTIGALRCAPVVSEDGSLPNEEEHHEAALALLADMGAIYEAVTCCGFADVAVTGWQALPAAGGCAGGVWEFQVGL